MRNTIDDTTRKIVAASKALPSLAAAGDVGVEVGKETEVGKGKDVLSGGDSA